MAISRRHLRTWIPPAGRIFRRWGAWGEKRTIAAADEPVASFYSPPDAILKHGMADLPFLLHPRIAEKLARNVAIALAGIFSIERNQCIAERKALRCPDLRIFQFAQRTQHTFDALEGLAMVHHEGDIMPC